MDDAFVEKIVSEINVKASTGSVLYLASGGSSIALSVRVINQLTAEVRSKLTFTLTDERYGTLGHADSNWQQFIDSGLEKEGMTLLPVLREEKLSREETADNFATALSLVLETAPYVVALFGVGADSHIAGLLPESPAVREETALVASYVAPPFERISITPPVFRRIDSAYVYARGESKRVAIEGLTQDLPFVSHPNQLVKWCRHYMVSFNQ